MLPARNKRFLGRDKSFQIKFEYTEDLHVLQCFFKVSNLKKSQLISWRILEKI